MPFTFRIIAIYAPPIENRNGKPAHGAGLEFRFTVSNCPDVLTAIEDVKASGFFAGDVKKLFGFVQDDKLKKEKRTEEEES